MSDHATDEPGLATDEVRQHLWADELRCWDALHHEGLDNVQVRINIKVLSDREIVKAHGKAKLREVQSQASKALGALSDSYAVGCGTTRQLLYRLACARAGIDPRTPTATAIEEAPHG